MMKTNSIQKLDTNWIEEFEKIDNQYEIFYNEDVSFISFHYVYIDRFNTVQTMKEEKLFMEKKNMLSRDELIRILKKNSFHNDIRYNVLSILKYNLDVNPGDVEHFLSSNNSTSYLSIIKNIDSIPFEKTITMFQDLNDIIILFNEKCKSRDKTKRILSASHKKTIRKLA